MRAKICNYGSCNNLCTDGSSYCTKHKAQQPKPFTGAKRFTEQYHSAEWQQFKKQVLIEQPMCELCGCSFNLQVHHIIPVRYKPSLFLDRANVQVLCRSCHQKETAKEILNRKVKK